MANRLSSLIVGGFPQGILVDMYGTLLQEKDGYEQSSMRIGDMLGVPYEEYRKARALTFHGAQTGQYPDAAARARATLAHLNVEHSDELAERAARLEVAHRVQMLEVYPDSERALRELKGRGIKLALISNTTPEWKPVFERSGLAPLFDRLVFSFEVGAVKPDPKIYLDALAAIESDPRKSLFVGDGSDQEIEGANRVGLVSVRIIRANQPIEPPDQRQQAAFEIHTLDEFVALIDR